jgi:hypothetical protein
MLILDILFLLWFFLRPVSSRIRGTPLALCRACELKSVILYHSGFVEGKDKNKDKNEEILLDRHEVRMLSDPDPTLSGRGVDDRFTP